MSAPEDEGWVEVTDPVEAQTLIGKNAANRVMGLTADGGAAGGGKVTEGERKTAFLATRLAGALQQINAAGKDAQSPGFASLFGGTNNAVGNFLTGSDRQRVENAQLDLLDSALTLGTGAAYTKEQLQGYRQSYFPQLGDSDAAVSDKKKRLELALQAARIGAGGANGQIDAALKAAGFTVPDKQAKGGDQASGTAGVAANGSAAPPAGPTTPTDGTPPPQNRAAGGTLQFGDEGPQMQAGSQRLTDAQAQQLQALAQSGASADRLAGLVTGFGHAPDAEGMKNLEGIAAFYADEKNRKVPLGFDYSREELKAVDAGDGAAGAAARGAGNALTLGFLDEAGALADTVTQGGTYDQNLDRRRGMELYDEQNSGLARFAGQVVGGLPLGALNIAGGAQAARAAGIAAVRSGVPVAEARALSTRILAGRTALEAAGLGAAYGFGDAEGGLGDRAAGAGIGGAVAGVLGGAASFGGSRFQRALAARRAARPAAGPTEAQLFGEAAGRRGIEYLPADVPGATATRMASGVTNVTLGGIPLSEAATRAVASAGKAKGEVANAIGLVGDTTRAGQAAQAGAKSFVEKSEGRGGQLYDAIPIAPKTDTQLGATRVALNEITQGLDSNPELSRLWTENPRLKATLEALTPTSAQELQRRAASARQSLDAAQEALRRSSLSGKPAAREAVVTARSALTEAQRAVERGPDAGLSWEDLKRFRSIIGEIAGRPSLGDDGAQNAAMRKLYGALSEDMRATAEKTGPGALRAFNRANTYWRGREARIDNVLSTVLGADLTKSPDAAYRAIEQMAQKKGGDALGLARLVRSLPDDEANTVRATLLDRLGLAGAGRQDATQEVYSPAEFMTQWSKLSARAKSTLFGGEHKQAIDDLVRVAEGMKGSQQFANSSKTSLGTNALATLATFWVNPLLSIGSVAGQFGAGKLLASPRFARWLASAPKKPNVSAQRAHVQRLSSLARAEPAIANDVLAIQQRLTEAFGSTPARLAADERRDRPRVGDRQNGQQQRGAERAQP